MKFETIMQLLNLVKMEEAVAEELIPFDATKSVKFLKAKAELDRRPTEIVTGDQLDNEDNVVIGYRPDGVIFGVVKVKEDRYSHENMLLLTTGPRIEVIQSYEFKYKAELSKLRFIRRIKHISI